MIFDARDGHYGHVLDGDGREIMDCAPVSGDTETGVVLVALVDENHMPLIDRYAMQMVTTRRRYKTPLKVVPLWSNPNRTRGDWKQVGKGPEYEVVE